MRLICFAAYPQSLSLNYRSAGPISQVSYGMALPRDSLSAHTRQDHAMSKSTGMKPNKLGSLLVALVFCCALQAEELSLEQAVQLALRQNVDVANATLDVSKSKARVKAFHTTLFPKLSFYAFASEQLVPV